MCICSALPHLCQKRASQFMHTAGVLCHLQLLHSIQLYKDVSLGPNNLWLYFCLGGIRSVQSILVQESKIYRC